MLAIILILVGVFLDQLTKFMVVRFIKDKGSITIVKNILRFTYVENSGAAFGMLQDQRLFFIIVTVITLLIVGYLLIRSYKTIGLWLIVALSFIVSGTIGNFIDRIRLGYVVDFISFRFFNRFDFAVFNVADILIVTGSIMLMIYILVVDNNEQL